MLILFISVQGSFIFNHMRIQHHKVSEKRSGKANIYLTFTAEEWENVEKEGDDEIEIDDKMFDIKSMHTENGKVTVYGHYDSEEDEMLAEQSDIEKKKSEHKKNTQAEFFLFFEKAIENNETVYTSFYKRNYAFVPKTYLFQYHWNESPPPKAYA